MLETRITCDGCTASLAPSGPVPGFRLVLHAEAIPVLGFITATVHDGSLTARLRECWVDAADRRLSAEQPGWIDTPTIHTIVIESVQVEEQHRNQGHFRRFLNTVCADGRFEMVVVEAVQNPILAEMLLRHGWECDTRVMDFYLVRKST